ncbi:hypothetical protein IFM89_031323 [Coptis chinensis]|uniref:Uncharacterized protein n=1 Tax=Coptis chinensis TaxID=261450 RepID=A0A835IZD7_9MAGN|nr:hypothetical protein IFM89_031323 [Coptis chinensis]
MQKTHHGHVTSAVNWLQHDKYDGIRFRVLLTPIGPFSWALAGIGILVDKVSSDESDKLLKMEDKLHQRIIGQDEAVKAISRAIRRARVVYDINGQIYNRIKSTVTKELKRYFRPSSEQVRRGDCLPVVNEVGSQGYCGDIMLKEVFERLKAKEIELQVLRDLESELLMKDTTRKLWSKTSKESNNEAFRGHHGMVRRCSTEISRRDSVIVDVDL